MGYDLHITRAKDWIESEQHPIHIDEWTNLVKSDPSFQLSDYHELKHPTSGNVIRLPLPKGSAVWTHPEKGYTVGFAYREGQISAKIGTADILAKALELAKALFRSEGYRRRGGNSDGRDGGDASLV